MAEWTKLNNGRLGDGLEFFDSGDFRIGPMTFDQDCSLENCNFGDLRVDKRPGVGEVLKLTTPRAVLQFKFESGAWYQSAGGTTMRIGKGPSRRVFVAVCVAVFLLVAALVGG